MFRFLAFGLIVVLSGCASTGAVTGGRDFTMSVGQQVSLPDAATLRYLGIANDSRCPPKVQCIRAGGADVLFDYLPGGSGAATTRVTLNTERARSSVIGVWRLQLAGLAQGNTPDATLRIDAANGTTTP